MKLLLLVSTICLVSVSAIRSRDNEAELLSGPHGGPPPPPHACRGPSCAESRQNKINERHCNWVKYDKMPTVFQEVKAIRDGMFYHDWALSPHDNRKIDYCAALCSATLGCNHFAGGYYKGGYNDAADIALDCKLYNAVNTSAETNGSTFYGTCDDVGHPDGAQYLSWEENRANFRWQRGEGYTQTCSWSVGDSMETIEHGENFERISPGGENLTEAECANLCMSTARCSMFYGYNHDDPTDPGACYLLAQGGIMRYTKNHNLDRKRYIGQCFRKKPSLVSQLHSCDPNTIKVSNASALEQCGIDTSNNPACGEFFLHSPDRDFGFWCCADASPELVNHSHWDVYSTVTTKYTCDMRNCPPGCTNDGTCYCTGGGEACDKHWNQGEGERAQNDDQCAGKLVTNGWPNFLCVKKSVEKEKCGDTVCAIGATCIYEGQEPFCACDRGFDGDGDTQCDPCDDDERTCTGTVFHNDRIRRTFLHHSNTCGHGGKAYDRGRMCCKWEGAPFKYSSSTCPSGHEWPCPNQQCRDTNFILIPRASHDAIHGLHKEYDNVWCQPKNADHTFGASAIEEACKLSDSKKCQNQLDCEQACNRMMYVGDKKKLCTGFNIDGHGKCSFFSAAAEHIETSYSFNSSCYLTVYEPVCPRLRDELLMVSQNRTRRIRGSARGVMSDSCGKSPFGPFEHAMLAASMMRVHIGNSFADAGIYINSRDHSRQIYYKDPSSGERIIKSFESFDASTLYTYATQLVDAWWGEGVPPEYEIVPKGLDWSNARCSGQVFDGSTLTVSGQDAYDAASAYCNRCGGDIQTPGCMDRLAAFLQSCILGSAGSTGGSGSTGTGGQQGQSATLACASAASGTVVVKTHEDEDLQILFVSPSDVSRGPMAAAIYERLLNPPYAQVTKQKADGGVANVNVHTVSAAHGPTLEANSVLNAVHAIMETSDGMSYAQCRKINEFYSAGIPDDFKNQCHYNYVPDALKAQWTDNFGNTWYAATICDNVAQMINRGVVGRRYDAARDVYDQLPSTDFDAVQHIPGGNDWVMHVRVGDPRGAVAVAQLISWANDATFQTGILQFKFISPAGHTFSIEKVAPSQLRLWQGYQGFVLFSFCIVSFLMHFFRAGSTM